MIPEMHDKNIQKQSDSLQNQGNSMQERCW